MRTPSDCHCGRETATSHPCHYGAYTCPNEGTTRFYGTGRPFSLSGSALKASVHSTIACDEHWVEWFIGQARSAGPTS
jgi:hypothetical protein